MKNNREEIMHHADEKRTSQRIQVEVPIYIGHEKAVTRDVSWSGIYFLTDQSFVEGADLSFSLDLTYALPGKTIKLDCLGEVVRIEQLGEKFGIAAKINEFQYLH
ncbi:MAG: PilZ domain-containing protein [Desulfuromonadales bacterium]|nr:PilZ domain-containing protein [Desulfuromonadales bacterium]